MRLDRRLWLTADKNEVVEDGDPRAAFLLGGAGTEVPDAEAERLGLTAAKPAPEPEPAAEEPAVEPAPAKAKKAPANKARKSSANKSK